MKTSISLLIAALTLGPGVTLLNAENTRLEKMAERVGREYTKAAKGRADNRSHKNDDDDRRRSYSDSKKGKGGSSKKHDHDDRRDHDRRHWDNDDRRDYYRRHGGYYPNYYRNHYYRGYGYPGYYRPRTSVGVVLSSPSYYYSEPYYDSGYYYQQQTYRSAPSYSGVSMSTVQRALNDHGFNAGTPDGVSGPRTRAAISAFRRARGLPAGTHVDDQLIYQLGLRP